jgi:hypothetical protein
MRIKEQRKELKRFRVPGLADATTGGGWLIQAFVFPKCVDIWFPINSQFDLPRP